MVVHTVLGDHEGIIAVQVEIPQTSDVFIEVRPCILLVNQICPHVVQVSREHDHAMVCVVVWVLPFPPRQLVWPFHHYQRRIFIHELSGSLDCLVVELAQVFPVDVTTGLIEHLHTIARISMFFANSGHRCNGLHCQLSIPKGVKEVVLALEAAREGMVAGLAACGTVQVQHHLQPISFCIGEDSIYPLAVGWCRHDVLQLSPTETGFSIWCFVVWKRNEIPIT
mmetsp:Transcript_99713/g.197744  ORF Transcript_99713/g.197744 Transcript_99713/m.197744 type:complete len:224 (-) Transcript_99713:789-1460(-)